MDDEISIGRNGTSISAKGFGVIAVISVIAIIAANFYGGLRIEWTITADNRRVVEEHHMLRVAQDRTSCILTMSQEDRTRFRDRYGLGAFKQMCPWMED